MGNGYSVDDFDESVQKVKRDPRFDSLRVSFPLTQRGRHPYATAAVAAHAPGSDAALAEARLSTVSGWDQLSVRGVVYSLHCERKRQSTASSGLSAATSLSLSDADSSDLERDGDRQKADDTVRQSRCRCKRKREQQRLMRGDRFTLQPPSFSATATIASPASPSHSSVCSSSSGSRRRRSATNTTTTTDPHCLLDTFPAISIRGLSVTADGRVYSIAPVSSARRAGHLTAARLLVHVDDAADGRVREWQIVALVAVRAGAVTDFVVKKDVPPLVAGALLYLFARVYNGAQCFDVVDRDALAYEKEYPCNVVRSHH